MWNDNICIATFKSLIKRQDESVWDELYQSTLNLAKSFDISDVVDRLLESITPRKRQHSIGEFLCAIHFWTIWLQNLNHVSLLRKTASMYSIYCSVL